MNVGVKELRSNLRRYLETAQRGEEVTVTERGRPVARIVPASGRSRYEELVANGTITPAQRPKQPSEAYPRILADVSLSDIVLEQRK